MQKSSHMWNWRSTLHNWCFCQVQSHVKQKLGWISKIQLDHILILCPSLRISRQLTATIVNGGGDSFWKLKDFQLSRAHDLDLGLGHTAYCSCITHQPWIGSYCILFVHHSSTSTYMPNLTEIKETFLWTDWHMYVWTDRHLRPTLLGRRRRVDLKSPRAATFIYCTETITAK